MLLRSLFVLLAFNVQAKPQLNWLQTDWPPHQIVNGPYQGQGTFDLLHQQITTLMPEFNHQLRLVSLAKLEQVFTEAETANCTVGTLFSEQRAGNRLFSRPIAVGPALAVGFLEGRLSEHQANLPDGVVIEKLTQDPKLTGVYQPNRFYPDAVLQVLQQADSNLSSYSLSGDVNAAALLLSGRVDYVVEYPERMEYFNQLLPEAATLEHRAIVNANIASVSHVTCTKDAVGQAAIATIDRLLPDLWQQQPYIDAMQRWLDDSARRRLSTDINQLQQDALMQFKSWPDNPVNARNQ
ncbi:conserved hypothetical protein [Arsukibacterium tuosuense]|uniref:Solute-binding protein family 3/N-terminal domain-containing protein n=1 Tax=Arsukibacterium tuosuense TaxID=1323745 RepID=A0A285JHR9_9GAMM|nr:hypothetical protein [Arsukibacterium tuosuense]SNY59623.1 conserved hypothetical protein [Arsukibacterium tuosuense]